MQAQAVLANVGATVSMSHTGNCYDNAVTESFFGTLKGECVERFSFQTRGQARHTIARVCRVLLRAIRSAETRLYQRGDGWQGDKP
jgi:putative transposase